MDLGPAYSFPLDPAVLPERSIAAVPPGRQRLLGVDFDIGGVVMLSMADAPAAALGLSDVSVAVAPPRPRFDALHLVMAACCPLPGNPRAPYAYVVLR